MDYSKKQNVKKSWLRSRSQIPNWILLTAGLLIAVVQTYLGWLVYSDSREQHRPKISFGLELETVDDPAGFRIVAPIEIGGVADARRVASKNYIASGKPGQRDYISTIDLDWSRREGHFIGDISSTEKDRRIVSQAITGQTSKHVATILDPETSLYTVIRVEYCDGRNKCYYFMRCAEIGNHDFVSALVYCGTRLGEM